MVSNDKIELLKRIRELFKSDGQFKLWWYQSSPAFDGSCPAEIFAADPARLERMYYYLSSGIAS